MKKLISLVLVILMAAVSFAGCKKAQSGSGSQLSTWESFTRPSFDEIPRVDSVLDGIDTRNYPIIDGSNVTLELNRSIYRACFPDLDSSSARYPKEHNQSYPAYSRLIDDAADLILVSEPTERIKSYASDRDVDLEYTVIGYDALVFYASIDSGITKITKEQAVNLFNKNSVTNCKELGGSDKPLSPVVDTANEDTNNIITSILEVIPSLNGNIKSASQVPSGNMIIGFSTYGSGIPEGCRLLEYDGKAPSDETIRKQEYKLTTKYYAVYRKDLEKDAPVLKIKDWLLKDEGQAAVLAAGLVTIK